MIQNETQRKTIKLQTNKKSGYRPVEHNQESNIQFNWSPRKNKKTRQKKYLMR